MTERKLLSLEDLGLTNSTKTARHRREAVARVNAMQARIRQGRSLVLSREELRGSAPAPVPAPRHFNQPSEVYVNSPQSQENEAVTIAARIVALHPYFARGANATPAESGSIGGQTLNAEEKATAARMVAYCRERRNGRL